MKTWKVTLFLSSHNLAISPVKVVLTLTAASISLAMDKALELFREKQLSIDVVSIQLVSKEDAQQSFKQ